MAGQHLQPVFDLRQIEHQIVRPETGSLSDCGGLSRLQMREPQTRQVAILGGERPVGEPPVGDNIGSHTVILFGHALDICLESFRSTEKIADKLRPLPRLLDRLGHRILAERIVEDFYFGSGLTPQDFGMVLYEQSGNRVIVGRVIVSYNRDHGSRYILQPCRSRKRG